MTEDTKNVEHSTSKPQPETDLVSATIPEEDQAKINKLLEKGRAAQGKLVKFTGDLSQRLLTEKLLLGVFEGKDLEQIIQKYEPSVFREQTHDAIIKKINNGKQGNTNTYAKDIIKGIAEGELRSAGLVGSWQGKFTMDSEKLERLYNDLDNNDPPAFSKNSIYSLSESLYAEQDNSHAVTYFSELFPEATEQAYTKWMNNLSKSYDEFGAILSTVMTENKTKDKKDETKLSNRELNELKEYYNDFIDFRDGQRARFPMPLPSGVSKAGIDIKIPKELTVKQHPIAEAVDRLNDSVNIIIRNHAEEGKSSSTTIMVHENGTKSDYSIYEKIRKAKDGQYFEDAGNPNSQPMIKDIARNKLLISDAESVERIATNTKLMVDIANNKQTVMHHNGKEVPHKGISIERVKEPALRENGGWHGQIIIKTPIKDKDGNEEFFPAEIYFTDYRQHLLEAPTHKIYDAIKCVKDGNKKSNKDRETGDKTKKTTSNRGDLREGNNLKVEQAMKFIRQYNEVIDLMEHMEKMPEFSHAMHKHHYEEFKEKLSEYTETIYPDGVTDEYTALEKITDYYIKPIFNDNGAIPDDEQIKGGGALIDIKVEELRQLHIYIKECAARSAKENEFVGCDSSMSAFYAQLEENKQEIESNKRTQNNVPLSEKESIKIDAQDELHKEYKPHGKGIDYSAEEYEPMNNIVSTFKEKLGFRQSTQEVTR